MRELIIEDQLQQRVQSAQSSLRVKVHQRKKRTPEQKASHKQLGAKTDATAPQVLIVDDTPFNIVALEAMLTSLNIKVETCFSGQEAIQLVQQRLLQLQKKNSSSLEMYKLILLDYSMPELDGPSTAKEIRRISGQSLENETQCLTVTPYICCLTAYQHEDYQEDALASGMNEFQTKPMSFESLQELLKKIGLL